jgi:hypothetical protein
MQGKRTDLELPTGTDRRLTKEQAAQQAGISTDPSCPRSERTYNCKPALESHAGCTHRGIINGKLIDDGLIAFLGDGSYPC